MQETLKKIEATPPTAEDQSVDGLVEAAEEVYQWANFLRGITVNDISVGPSLDRLNAALRPPQARVTGLERDAQRRDYLLRSMSGAYIRMIVGEMSDTADIEEFRQLIDAAMNRDGQ